MTVLVVGGGGREHAICAALKKSPKVSGLHCAPGNGGIQAIAACHPHIKATDIDGMIALAKDIKADYVFVAPDDPLTLGMVDMLEAAGIKAFGPRRNAAIIEGSKSFSKGLMRRYGIPTAAYAEFTEVQPALNYIKTQNTFPSVIKCDGLALGKGVIIAQNCAEAETAVLSMLEGGRFGESGKRIIIEEFMTGPEVTVLAFTDGKFAAPMLSSSDHKRAFDNDEGLNTGGMGAIAPTPFYTIDIQRECLERIINPTIYAMSIEGRPFKGVLYFGLMLTPDGVKVIEYNCRFGDPEAQALLPLLKTDLFDIMEAVIEERLANLPVEWSCEHSACVVMASGGYPETYAAGHEITGLDKVEGVQVYHAGTSFDPDSRKYFTAGGRVLNVAATGDSLKSALGRAYAEIEKLAFRDAFYRRDIGRKAL